MPRVGPFVAGGKQWLRHSVRGGTVFEGGPSRPDGLNNVSGSRNLPECKSLCKRFVTFVSYRRRWVWPAGRGAWKLRHSLTTIQVRSQKIRSLIRSDQPKVCNFLRASSLLFLCQNSRLGLFINDIILNGSSSSAPSLSPLRHSVRCGRGCG